MTEETCSKVEIPDFVGLAEIASARGVTRTAVLHSVHKGHLRAFKIGGRWLVSRSDAEEYIKTPVTRRGRKAAEK